MRRILTPSLIIALLVVVASVGAYAAEEFLIGTVQTSLADVQGKIKDKKIEVVKASRIKGAAGSLDESEAIVASHFTSKSSIVDYLETLQNNGKELGSTVKINTVSDSGSGAYPRVNISFDATGSFDSVMRLIGIAENATYDTTIPGLSLTMNAPDAKTGVLWTANTQLSVGLTPVASTTSKKP